MSRLLLISLQIRIMNFLITINFGKGVGMAKWVKWTNRVEQEVVSLQLSSLWGFSEDDLCLDNYAVLFCFFEYWYICVLHSMFFEIFVSELYISSIKLLLRYKVYGIRFRSEIICLFQQGKKRPPSFGRRHLAMGKQCVHVSIAIPIRCVGEGMEITHHQ